MFPKKLKEKLELRKANNALRTLGVPVNHLIDFSSNDYLGFSKSQSIFNSTAQYLKSQNILENGATGSRLLSGNHSLYKTLEAQLKTFYNSQSALVFNSGYDANIGFFSSVPQRGDIVLYDAYIHASIRDGIAMSHAKAYKFEHNSVSGLEALLERFKSASGNPAVYVITESVFSMDGDTPDLIRMANLCKLHQAYFVVDEAHAVGVFGNKGVGLVSFLNLESLVFARIATFGKALGCHGAVILGSKQLINYLINFSRSFIYTTALAPHSLATIYAAHCALKTLNVSSGLHKNIAYFNKEVERLNLQTTFIKSNSAIHCCVISGNQKVKKTANYIQELGYNVKAILSPTVPENQERLRFCLHTYNTFQDITNVLCALKKCL